MNEKLKIFIVEDDELTLKSMEALLAPYGMIHSVRTKAHAKLALEREEFDIAFFDLDLEKEKAGFDLTAMAKGLGIYTVIVTGHKTREYIKAGYQNGAMDYLTKPATAKSLKLVLNKFKNSTQSDQIFTELQKIFITRDEETLEELELLKSINLSHKPIFLSGPTGTGKTQLAKFIHDIHFGDSRPFVSINCSQFNEGTLESELFGHVKGAFTGAHKDKTGVLKLADGGTLFLDEVHSLSMGAQKKLMKAIEEGKFRPVGSEQEISSKFRIISATCEDVLELIQSKKFRNDLYARINTFNIKIKGLVDRPCDIELLLNHFLNKRDRKIVLSEEALEVLKKYNWPENVREIDALVENWHIKGVGVVEVDDLPVEVFSTEKKSSNKLVTPTHLKIIKEIGLNDYIDMIKKEAVEAFFQKNKLRKSKTAEELKISPSTFTYLQKKHEHLDIYWKN